MESELQSEEFSFLNEDSSPTANEFLKQRLTHLRRHFSYEELSGLSIEEINNQTDFYYLLLKNTLEHFTDPNSIYANNPSLVEWAIDGECDLYEPLTERQEAEIASVCNEIQRNFDKAKEDAQDRKIDRISKVISLVPGIPIN